MTHISELRQFYNKEKRKNFIFMIVIAVTYIFLELVFNYLLMNQMSIQSSETDIHHIENLGRILSGIGLGILIYNFFSTHNLKNILQRLVFLLVIFFITIPISFYAQKLIVNFIVKEGSVANKSKALLITQVSNTMVPFFADNQFKNTFADHERKDYQDEKLKIKKTQFYADARACMTANELHLNSQLDKALFPYRALIGEFTEQTYKKVVMDFQKCMYKNNNDLAESLKNESFMVATADSKAYTRADNSRAEIMKEAYARYKVLDQEYQMSFAALKQEYKTAKLSKKEVLKRQEEINQRYIDSSHAIFGKDSVVPVKLTEEKFYANKYVERFITQESTKGQKNNKNLAAKQLDQHALERLEDKVLLAYNMHRQFIPDLQIKTTQNIITEVFAQQADEAYKAIVVPIVVLTFSVGFLLLNVVSLITSLLFYKLGSAVQKFKKYFVMVALVVVLALPFMLGVSTKPVEHKSLTASLAMNVLKVVVYYEKIIIKLYSNH